MCKSNIKNNSTDASKESIILNDKESLCVNYCGQYGILVSAVNSFIMVRFDMWSDY